MNFLLAVVPLGTYNTIGSIPEAVENALESKSEELIVDGSVSEYFWFVPGIWAQHCYKVEGQAARAAFRLDLIPEDTIHSSTRK